MSGTSAMDTAYACIASHQEEIEKLQAELDNLRQVKSSMSDVIDQKDKQIEALKAREVAHLALIQDYRKGLEVKPN